MKTKMLGFLTAMFLLGTMAAFAGGKKENIKVSGNCGMCKKTIETAAKSVEGVHSAEWSRETKLLAVHYDKSKTNTDNIQKAVAKSGYDTEKYKADDAVYDKLHSCCKYDRELSSTKKARTSEGCGHAH